jgi:uncharacterized membrane protein
MTGYDWGVLVLSFVHDLSIAVYVGGAVAMEFVIAPAQASIPPAQAQIMGEKTSSRFLVLVWSSLALILITGLFRLQINGMLNADGLSMSDSYGRTIWAMLFFWFVLAVNGGLITFVLRPTLQGKLKSGSSQANANQDRDAKMKAATWIQYITRADLVIAIVVTLLGASLSRGGLL